VIPHLRLVPAVLAACVLVACKDGARAAARDTAVARKTGIDVVRQAETPYEVIDVPNGGRLVGHVRTSSLVRRDSTVPVTVDADLCRDSAQVILVERNGPWVQNVIVWLEDARTGKRLPRVRRYDVVNTGCALEPRVFAAVAGGMLNVASQDPITHRTRFTRTGRSDSVLDVVQETDRGQVVPTGKVLARPGLIAVTCERHPWTHGWIAVFDHPYFDVTGRDGSFEMDSIPPGNYRLVAWQEKLGRREQTITIRAGTVTAVDVRY
jgi:hypothetical protein